MDLRLDYLQTEAGLIPKDWLVYNLGSIGNVQMCKRVFKHQTSSNGEIPFYKIGTFGGTPDAFITKMYFDELKKKYPFPNPGDILISAAGTIGRTIVYDGMPAYFQDSNIVWISNDESVVKNEYLYHCYQVIKWSVSHGGTVARLYNDNLKYKIYVAVPPTIEEQKLISSALNDINELLATLDKTIAKKRDMKQAAMSQLLTGQIRLQGQNEEWVVKRLGEQIKKFQKTSRLSSTGKAEGKFPFFTNSTKPCDKYLDEFDFNGEVIIANTGGVAYFNYFKGPFAAMADCLVFESRLVTRFLYFLLKLMEKKINDTGFSGSGIKHLDKSYFFDIELYVPSSLVEQEAIANILSDMDEELLKLEVRHNKTKELKQAMMQELLTGKTRLLNKELIDA